MEENVKADRGSDDVENHLRDVGPDHSRQSAFVGIDQRQATMTTIDVISPVPRTIEITMEMAKTRTPSAARAEEKKCPAVSLRMRVPKRSHQLIRGIQLASKVRGQEKTDDNAREQVTQDHLQKFQIAIEREARSADDGQRARLGRDNRKRNGPPGNVAVGQKIIPQRPLRLRNRIPNQVMPAR